MKHHHLSWATASSCIFFSQHFDLCSPGGRYNLPSLLIKCSMYLVKLMLQDLFCSSVCQNVYYCGFYGKLPKMALECL